MEGANSSSRPNTSLFKFELEGTEVWGASRSQVRIPFWEGREVWPGAQVRMQKLLRSETCGAVVELEGRVRVRV